MKSALVVNYHFVPAHNVGVRQFVGYCRYLPEFGWRPIVLTRDWTAESCATAGGPYGLSFQPELRALLGPDTLVVTAPDRPFDNAYLRTHRRLQRWSARASPRILRGGAVVARKIWSQGAPLFGNFPDELRGWADSAVEVGRAVMREHHVGAIVSNCPPASNHVVASRLARSSGRPWFPYFGDLYTFDVGPHSVTRTGLQRAEARWRNARWLRSATGTLAVAPGLVRYLEDTYGVPGEVVVVGYDPADFSAPAPERGGKFLLSHVGSVYGDQRPSLLFDALDVLLGSRPDVGGEVRVRLVGSKMESELRAMIVGRPCAEVVSIESKVSPAEAVRLQRASDVLLLLPFMARWNRTRYGTYSYPSKLFEYFGARRRILSLPNDGDWVDELLRSTGAGQSVATAEDGARLLGGWFDEWRGAGELRWDGREHEIAKYTHREQARRIATALDRHAASPAASARATTAVI